MRLLHDAVVTIDAEDRRARVIALVEDNVRNELRRSVGINQLAVTDDEIDTLTSAVTSELLYAFEIDWNPDWVKPGDVHSWASGDQYFGRCGVCLLDSPRLQ